ncbi:MAG: hypothetical protein J6N21_23230 [Butyrivibrio sp.]|nr:hypothetical protein [Butyrivibrio sp.]
MTEKLIPCDLKQGRRGMLYYAITYIAKKYTNREHPRAVSEFYDIIIAMFGLDSRGEEIDIGDPKTLSRYMEFLEAYSNLIPRYGRWDRFEEVIRVMMGGKINHVGESPMLYYFTGDGGYEPSKEDLEASVSEITDSFFFSDDMAFRLDRQDVLMPEFRTSGSCGVVDVMNNI